MAVSIPERARVDGRAVRLRSFVEFVGDLPVVPAGIILGMAILGVFANFIAPHDPLAMDLGHRLNPPFWQEGGLLKYPLGTDLLGRDILSRMIFGARVSLFVGTVAVAAGCLVGTALGLVSGYMGKAVDALIMRATDTMLAIPYILVALVIVAILGASLMNIILVVAIMMWAQYARMVRGEVLSLRESDFVRLAKVAGCNTPRILAKHILPNVLNTVIILATLQVAAAILFEAILSFLGVGVPPPTPTWGLMVAEGRQYISRAWWLSTMPGLAIVLIVLGINLLGDWLRDRFDPLRRQV